MATTKGKKGSKPKPTKASGDLNLQFEIKDSHKKALLSLWRCGHSGTYLTFPELSRELGVGAEIKSFKDEVWKELRSSEMIVSGPSPKTFTLSEKGSQLALSLASTEEIDKYWAPLTNEDHHKKIRAKLSKVPDSAPAAHKAAAKTGPKIFDFLLDHANEPMTRLEICTKLPTKMKKGRTNPDGPDFYYGFRNLVEMGMICTDGEASKEEMMELYQECCKKQGDKRKKEDESDGDDNKSSDEKKPEKIRLRGGRKKYKLSEKAFLRSECTNDGNGDDA